MEVAGVNSRTSLQVMLKLITILVLVSVSPQMGTQRLWGLMEKMLEEVMLERHISFIN
jgi:hypothetical protein